MAALVGIKTAFAIIALLHHFVAAADDSPTEERRRKFLSDMQQRQPVYFNQIIPLVKKALHAPRTVQRALPVELAQALKSVEESAQGDKGIMEDFHQSIAAINRPFSDLLYEGDMVLLSEEKANETGRDKRQVQIGNGYPKNKWSPKTPISYRFESSIDAATRDIIRVSFKFWQDHTCLSFQENGGSSPKLRFFKGQGCYSLVGKAYFQSEQEISIGNGCETFATVTHEIGHALGMFHHHSRYDRDNFITVLTQNLRPGWERQFAKESSSRSTNLNVPYDYGSNMHYTGYDPANQKIMFLAKDKRYQHTMGNNYGPLFSDLLLLNRYYQCSEKCGANRCKNGGFPHPRNCGSCICPNGFGGSDCSQRAAPEGGASSCGQTVQASATAQTLSGNVRGGSPFGPQRLALRQAGCHYHIQAPTGQRVELKVQRLSGVCTQECALGATEVKFGDMTRGGARLCCPSHATEFGTVTTSGSLAVISVYSQRGDQAFTVQYRAVGGSQKKSSNTSRTGKGKKRASGRG